MPTDSWDFTVPLSQTSPFPPFNACSLLATRIRYALCCQSRSVLWLCHDRCGAGASIPKGFSTYSQRRRTGTAFANADKTRTTNNTLTMRNLLTGLLLGRAYLIFEDDTLRRAFSLTCASTAWSH